MVYNYRLCYTCHRDAAPAIFERRAGGACAADRKLEIFNHQPNLDKLFKTEVLKDKNIRNNKIPEAVEGAWLYSEKIGLLPSILFS